MRLVKPVSRRDQKCIMIGNTIITNIFFYFYNPARKGTKLVQFGDPQPVTKSYPTPALLLPEDPEVISFNELG